MTGGTVGFCLVIVLTIAACGADRSPDTSGGGAPSPLTVAQALKTQTGEKLRVRGAVVVTQNGARICDALAESHPPQCAGGARLLNLAASDLPPGSEEFAGVHWTESVELIVTVEGRDLRHVATAKAR